MKVKLSVRGDCASSIIFSHRTGHESAHSFMPGPDWELLERSPDEQLHSDFAVVLVGMLLRQLKSSHLGSIRVIAPAARQWLSPIGPFEGVSHLNHVL